MDGGAGGGELEDAQRRRPSASSSLTTTNSTSSHYPLDAFASASASASAATAGGASSSSSSTPSARAGSGSGSGSDSRGGASDSPATSIQTTDSAATPARAGSGAGGKGSFDLLYSPSYQQQWHTSQGQSAQHADPTRELLSFPQQHQPAQKAHHAVLNYAVESSRFNWNTQQGVSSYGSQQPFDSPYYGHAYDAPVAGTTSQHLDLSGSPRGALQHQQHQQEQQQQHEPSISWNSALSVALRYGSETTVGDVLKLSNLAASSSSTSTTKTPSSSGASSASGAYPGSQFENENGTSSSASYLYDEHAPLEPTGVSPRIKPFISKLEYLLSHPEDETGTSFIVCHTQPRLLQEVLPRFYQHANIHSFTRQLNVYGFHRLSPSDLISKLDILSTNDYSGWSHPLFTRDDKTQLHLLTPKPSRARMQKKIEKHELQVQARHDAEHQRQQMHMEQHQPQYGAPPSQAFIDHQYSSFQSYDGGQQPQQFGQLQSQSQHPHQQGQPQYSSYTNYVAQEESRHQP